MFAFVYNATTRAYSGAIDYKEAPTLANSIRRPDILKMARQHGKVTVEGLAQHFDVTLQTIRRDLNELCDSGELDRVHGGAILPSSTANIRYEDRQGINLAGKQAIASLCAEHIPNDVSLFLNIGTSTEAVARALCDHQNLLVVTNNLNVAAILQHHPSAEVILTGGHLRKTDGGLIGQPAIETIRKFKFDLAVIGCSALDLDGDMLDFDMQEIAVSQAILNQSRKTYLVADHSKFERKAPVKIASLRDIDTFFTDAALTTELSADCKHWNTTIKTI